MPMTTKPGRVVTYNKERHSLQSQDLLITGTYKVTRQSKYVISLPPQSLWPLNLPR